MIDDVPIGVQVQAEGKGARLWIRLPPYQEVNEVLVSVVLAIGWLPVVVPLLMGWELPGAWMAAGMVIPPIVMAFVAMSLADRFQVQVQIQDTVVSFVYSCGRWPLPYGGAFDMSEGTATYEHGYLKLIPMDGPPGQVVVPEDVGPWLVELLELVLQYATTDPELVQVVWERLVAVAGVLEDGP